MNSHEYLAKQPCDGKPGWPGKGAAAEVAKRISRRLRRNAGGHTEGRVVEAYACQVCGLWHVGHVVKDIRRKGPHRLHRRAHT